jgi:hypothetical protein
MKVHEFAHKFELAHSTVSLIMKDKAKCLREVKNKRPLQTVLIDQKRLHNTYLLTYGAEPFWRSRQFCSYSRISQHFMEPEGSLLCSQEPSTSPCPELD